MKEYEIPGDINLELCQRCNKSPSVVKRVEHCGAFGEKGGIRCWLICRSCEDAGRVQKVESNRWSTFFGAFKHAAWHWNKMIEGQKDGHEFDATNVTGINTHMEFVMSSNGFERLELRIAELIKERDEYDRRRREAMATALEYRDELHRLMAERGVTLPESLEGEPVREVQAMKGCSVGFTGDAVGDAVYRRLIESEPPVESCPKCYNGNFLTVNLLDENKKITRTQTCVNCGWALDVEIGRLDDE